MNSAEMRIKVGLADESLGAVLLGTGHSVGYTLVLLVAQPVLKLLTFTVSNVQVKVKIGLADESVGAVLLRAAPTEHKFKVWIGGKSVL